ncbi:lipopolysaccharide core heptose(I) kinase RfaP [Desulfuromonas versatilis]|uniref:Lipopolysaccharide core heptose(I) kinase RfaP n=1 Tax=Desulfuromonas versatilis TaxID=2802975 RepID=A0ABM8HWU4_9BACT|nr:lipopolysaccharide core heptose(I) kinase RfaP [Desulfuromonas versatilis]BCR05195.1 lipopolysaccharide core heptose(I) kinase RfaP [Desulfuromonas versatilis]
MMQLEPDFRGRFAEPPSFEQMLSLEGEVFRELAGRRTLRFFLGEKGYFAKLHFGVGWKEILKNLSHFKLPVLGADNERRAIRRCEELGVETMRIAGYGCRGWNPARIQSFLVTEELADTISLEDLCRDWKTNPPPFGLKKALIEKVAGMAAALHENGVNHRDFYICHFLLPLADLERVSRQEAFRLHLIDLHRVQLRPRTPQRWIVKDVAGLYFSSMDIGLTRRDILRFMRAYRRRALRSLLQDERVFWERVERRALALYRKEFGRDPASNPSLGR